MVARLLTYPPAMVLQRPSGFIEPCLPSKAVRPPSGPLWVHEIKHDGYRLMVRRDGSRVRCFTRNGHGWADRFPSIVDAALRLKATSFLIDGEAVIEIGVGPVSGEFHMPSLSRNLGDRGREKKRANAPKREPSCGGFTPTAERTVGPARMIVGELDTQTRN
jgi:hypothetical protein